MLEKIAVNALWTNCEIKRLSLATELKMWSFLFNVYIFVEVVLIGKCQLELGEPITPSRFTEWEITTMTDIYYQFCPSEKCDGTVHKPQQILQIPNITTCCFPKCSCNESTCATTFLRENCCPELLNSITAAPVASKRCSHPQGKPWNPNIIPTKPISEAFLMNAKCNIGKRRELGDEIADKCDFSERYTDLATRVPVSLAGFSDTYINEYCALCFGLTRHLVPWKPRIDCTRGIFEINSLDKIIDDIHQSIYCTLRFERPVEDTLFLPSCGLYISECNMTGNWKEYDPLIEAGCAAFYSPFQNIYKNVFCYLCNRGDSPSDIPMCGFQHSIMFTFSMVLKYEISQDSVNATNDTTNEGKGVFDPFQDIYLEVKCLLYKVYVGDGKCENIIEKIGGLGYKVFLKFTPLIDLPARFSVFDNFMPQINVYSNNMFEEAFMKVFVSDYYLTDKDYVVGASTFVEYFLRLNRLHLPTFSSSGMAEIVNLQSLLKYHKRNVSFEDVSGELVTFFLELDTVDSVFETQYALLYDRENIPIASDSVETLLPIHDCPVVELDLSVYRLINGSSLTVRNESYTIDITRAEYILKEDKPSILICLNAFQSLTKQYYDHKTQASSGQTVNLNLAIAFLFLLYNGVIFDIM